MVAKLKLGFFYNRFVRDEDIELLALSRFIAIILVDIIFTTIFYAWVYSSFIIIRSIMCLPCFIFPEINNTGCCSRYI